MCVCDITALISKLCYIHNIIRGGGGWGGGDNFFKNLCFTRNFVSQESFQEFLRFQDFI